MSKDSHTGRFLDYADSIRAIAVLAVVTLHASAAGVVRYGQLDAVNWWGANVVDSFCRWAVPVFIMLSGALLLDPSRRDAVWTFYRKRLMRIGIPLVFWAAFYFYWKHSYYGEPVDVGFIVSALRDGLSFNHMYFLIIITGLYAVTPLLRKAMALSPRWLVWAVLIAYTYFVASGALYSITGNHALTLFLPYIVFYILGHLLRPLRMPRCMAQVSLLCYMVASVVIAIATGVLVQRWGIDDYRALRYYNHFHPAVIVQSISALLAIRACYIWVSATRWEVVARVLGPLSFGIYLIHVVFLDMFRGYTASLYARASIVAIAIEVTVVFVCSAVATYLIRKVPVISYTMG